MHKLIDYVCGELEEIERKADKGSLSASDLQYADTLAHLKKNLLKSEELSDYSSRGYSRDGYRGYDDSYRRDRMGRYARRPRGYSMAEDDMISELHELMKSAPDEQTKKEFQRFINKIESM